MTRIWDSFGMVLRSNTVEQLKVRFENCIRLIQQEKVRDMDWLLGMMCIMLEDAIQWPQGNQPYYIVDGANGLLLFLYLYWVSSIENLKEFTQLLDTFTAPEESKISVDEIDALYSLVDEKFSYTKQVIRDKPLYIISIDCSHIAHNSSYFFHKLGDQIQDAIILTHPKKGFFCAPQFSFLNELGHAVHSRLLRDACQYPISIDKILERMFSGCIGAEREINVEVFSDCFAIAAACQTQWEGTSPLARFQEKYKRQLFFYMKMLFDTYDKNPMGQLSYDELVTTYAKANRSEKR